MADNIPLKTSALQKFDSITNELLGSLLSGQNVSWQIGRFLGFIEGVANAYEVPPGYFFNPEIRAFVKK